MKGKQKFREYFKGMSVLAFITSLSTVVYAQNEFYVPNYLSDYTIMASNQVPQIKFYQRVFTVMGQLTFSDPTAALQSQAYRDIIKMGAEAVSALKDIAGDLGVNTDVRKWALRLLGETADKKQASEVKSFLGGVINDDSGQYQWWHKTEAQNGLDRLYKRFPEEAPKEKVEIKDVSSVYKKTEEYAKRLTTSEPSVALQSQAYRDIIKMGAEAVSALKDIAGDLGVNTDVRKWALRLLGETADKKQASEVKSFLGGVINDDSGQYQWWHKTEARNGLDRLYKRFPSLEQRSQETGSKSYRVSSFKPDSDIMSDFLPTKRIK